MIIATLLIKGSDQKLGKWEFAALPHAGDFVALRLDNDSVVFEVIGVIHAPVTMQGIDTDRVAIPTVTLAISAPKEA